MRLVDQTTEIESPQKTNNKTFDKGEKRFMCCRCE